VKKYQNGDFPYYFMEKCHFSIFFLFYYAKSAEMAIFHIILWKNAILAYFFHFIKQKSAEIAIFHIIL
jgi:hypothetical protein